MTSVPPVRSLSSPSIAKSPVLLSVSCVVPEAEATRIFWLPVSLSMVNAFPTAAPDTFKSPIGVAEPIPTFPEALTAT